MSQDYLLVVAERQALAWILKSSKMGFSHRRRRAAESLERGDRLFIYTTRGCFHNPTRDRGRIIGEAIVAGTARTPRRPILIAGREYTKVCELELSSLTAPHTGVELAPLIARLNSFPDTALWWVRMRRPLVRLSHKDAALLRRRLTPVAGDPDQVVADYVALGGPVSPRYTRGAGAKGSAPRAG